MAKFFVYSVEKVDDYVNTASSLSHDYSDDFFKLANLRGYVKNDFYITDTDDLSPGYVYFIGGALIRVKFLVTSFDFFQTIGIISFIKGCFK